MSTNGTSLRQRFEPENGIGVPTVLAGIGVILLVATLVLGGRGLDMLDGTLAAMIGTYGIFFLIGSVTVRLFPLIIKALQ